MRTTLTSAAAVVLWLAGSCLAQTTQPVKPAGPPAGFTLTKMDDAKSQDWLTRWDKNISGEAKNYRVCDRDVGEDIAWTMTPIMEGFYYGFMATRNAKYIDLWVDWTDSLIKRAVKEPDGYLGWPGKDPHGTEVDKLSSLFGDSMLSDAMVFRPIVLLAGEILKDPALKAKYGPKAESYLKLAEQMFEKWDKRGGWRQTKDGGMISVVTYYGISSDGKEWTAGPEARADANLAFSHPGNKANHVARWMLALWDVTGKGVYKEHAEKWFVLLKSRMKSKADGTFEIWNYWQAAGPWDYKDGKTKHGEWVHPNAGYYHIDLIGIMDAYEHGLVFTKDDVARLIATAKTAWCGGGPTSPVAGMEVSVLPATGTAKAINACFANAKTAEAKSAGAGALSGKVVSVEWDDKAKTGKIVVQPKNAAAATIETDKDTKVEVLRMWTALAPYDVEIQKQYEATASPDGWGGVSGAPWYLMLQNRLREGAGTPASGAAPAGTPAKKAM